MPIEMEIVAVRTQIGDIKKIVYVVTGTIYPPNQKPVSIITGNRLSMPEAIEFYNGKAKELARATLTKHGYNTI